MIRFGFEVKKMHGLSEETGNRDGGGRVVDVKIFFALDKEEQAHQSNKVQCLVDRGREVQLTSFVQEEEDCE